MSMQPYQPPQPPAVQPKSVAAALVIGLFFPGFGNIYAGRPGKGILIIACTGVAWLLMLVTLGLGLPLVAACNLWGAWTANNDATRWNTAHGFIT